MGLTLKEMDEYYQMMERRIEEINEEFAQLPQMDGCDLTLETVGTKGDIKATIIGNPERQNRRKIAEKVFALHEPLDSIREVFGYPDTFTPRSKDIALKGLKMAYFDEWGNLIVERDGTTEKFRVKDYQKLEVTMILKEKLGSKFKG